MKTVTKTKSSSITNTKLALATLLALGAGAVALATIPLTSKTPRQQTSVLPDLIPVSLNLSRTADGGFDYILEFTDQNVSEFNDSLNIRFVAKKSDNSPLSLNIGAITTNGYNQSGNAGIPGVVEIRYPFVFSVRTPGSLPRVNGHISPSLISMGMRSLLVEINAGGMISESNVSNNIISVDLESYDPLMIRK
jgi:hypothetical protein